MKAKKQVSTILSNEKGFVLLVGLMFLAIIAILGATAFIATTTDLKIASNYRASVQAFYVAEAGLEHAKANFDILRDDLDWSNWPDWSDSPPPPPTPPPAGWPTSGTIGVGGEYTITTRYPTPDSITVKSTGTIAGATSVVEALVIRHTLPNVPAALGFAGDVGVSFNYKDAFLIDGGAKFGVTSDDETQTKKIKKDLKDGNMVDQVKGKEWVQGTDPSVGEATETGVNISEFASTMKNIADGDWPTDMGTVDNPKIVHISAAKGQDFKGSITGVGILIIEGDDFFFAFSEETINWKGLVVITGNSVGGSLGNNVKIHGTLIINENIKDEWRWFGIDGEMELIYSQDYLDIAQDIISATVSSWKEVGVD